MKSDTRKENKEVLLKFNCSFYSPKIVAKTVKEFKRSYGRQVNFFVKKSKKFIEVKIITEATIGEGLVDEFANHALILDRQ